MEFKSPRHRRTPNSIDGFMPRSSKPGAGPRRTIGIPDRHARKAPDATALPMSPLSSRRRSQLGTAKAFEGIALDLDDKETPRKRRFGRFRRDKQAKKTRSRKQKILRGLLIAGVPCLLIGGWFGIKVFGNLHKVFQGNVISDAHALLSSKKLKGESTGRVNVLLAGNSSDDAGHAGAELTDSIMVVSIDTRNRNSSFMISIPRDTWVNIPDVGHAKINTANTVADFNQPNYPKGGMGQLEQVITQHFGIPLHYYALVNYSAFRDAVNAVGGIDINVQSPDPRGLYDPNIDWTTKGPLVKLKNGQQHLDGRLALNLARARGDAYNAYGFPQGDFNRTENQRKMLLALRQKASSAGVLSNPVRIGQLFDAVGKNVRTDLTVAETIRFANITKSMDTSKLQSLSYSVSGDKPLLANYTTGDGQAVLTPAAGLDDFTQIQRYYQQLTSTNPVVREAASVVVLNGSEIEGLARKQATGLETKGFTVASTANATASYPDSLIVDNSAGKKPASKKVLQQALSTASVVTSATGNAQAQEAASYTADFVVILGKSADSSAQAKPTQAGTN